MENERSDLARVVIIGSSCSGKSTFAKTLAEDLGIEHVELDRLFWLPGWIEREHQAFRSLVVEKAGSDRWVIDGNYRRVRDAFWPRATAVIWLDYPFPVVMWRSLKRTVSRAWTGQEICNGNRESWRKAFFSRDSILLWVIRTHHAVRERSQRLLAENAYPNAAKIRLKSPADASAFLAEIRPT